MRLLESAPVSEAKAQGVVMLDERAAFEAAMRTLPDLTGAIDYALQCFDPGQDRYYMEQGCSGLELNSMFVVWSMARAAPVAPAMRGVMKIGDRYNWKNQPERLVYVGMCAPRNGRWHQFAKVESPEVVWCEVLTSDLHMLEETKQNEGSQGGDV